MKVLIAGGTGFLGYHTLREALRREHTVTALGRSPLPQVELFPPSIRLLEGDLAAFSEQDLVELTSGYEGVVFAAGADDRFLPSAPAYDFFYDANVMQCTRLLRAARQNGVRRAVVLNSYFAYFDRLWPHMRLAERHPYIRSRVEQAREAISVGGSELEVMILELPYIFGVLPAGFHYVPMWKPLVDYARSPWPLFYTPGGTAMIAVQHVAEAIVGALERGEGGHRYPIGDENRTWEAWLGQISELAGRRKRFIALPKDLVRMGMYGLRLWHQVRGQESGLDPVAFVDLQATHTYYDPAPSREALGYGQGGLDAALTVTVRACIQAPG
jgi:dihydroflavonol-4-reductase